MLVKERLKKAAELLGYEIKRIVPTPKFEGIPRSELYRKPASGWPLYSPWFGEDFARYYAIAAPRTLVSADRCYVLSTLLRQALSIEGDVWECGVYKGGTAAMLAKIMIESKVSKKLLLFDTFAGMPETDADRDLHQEGDFADTSAEDVAAYVNAPDVAVLREGFIPDTFAGLESHRIAFAHIDVDIYKSILDCLEFIWPRLSSGGFIVFDDYGFPSCPGALQAVDEFFSATTAFPLCLPTGQAVVFKH
jgi:O-methyltransferase